MYNKIKSFPFRLGHLAFAEICICLLSACQSIETEIEEADLTPSVYLSATLEEEAITKATPLYPPKGTYYLGYQETKKSDGTPNEEGLLTVSPLYVGEMGVISDDESTPPEGSDGSYKTKYYWINIKQNDGSNADLTLSNVGRDKDTDLFPADNDILWGKQTVWLKPLPFVLSHRMAQVRVYLEIDKTDINQTAPTISTVSMNYVRDQFTFSRTDGVVTASEGSAEKELSKSTDASSKDYYGSILPPQERINEGKVLQLQVTTDDGKTYVGNLPYGMSQFITGSTTEREDVPLQLKAGHILELTATITDNTDYTVLFTYATLVDWKYIKTVRVAAKPAGLYLASELEACITEYNKNSEATNVKLLKYGVYEDSTWKFTLQRSIAATSIMGPFKDSAPTLTQTAAGTYKITGKTAAELNVTDKDNCF